MASLVVAAPDGGSKTHRLDRLPFRVGRHSENDLVLRDAAISKHHCELGSNGATVWLRDVGSSNGTFVNGNRTAFTRLADGDVVDIGPFRITFRNELRGTLESGDDDPTWVGALPPGVPLRPATSTPPSPLPPREERPPANLPSDHAPTLHGVPVPSPRPAPAALTPLLTPIAAPSYASAPQPTGSNGSAYYRSPAAAPPPAPTPGVMTGAHAPAGYGSSPPPRPPAAVSTGVVPSAFPHGATASPASASMGSWARPIPLPAMAPPAYITTSAVPLAGSPPAPGAFHPPPVPQSSPSWTPPSGVAPPPSPSQAASPPSGPPWSGALPVTFAASAPQPPAWPLPGAAPGRVVPPPRLVTPQPTTSPTADTVAVAPLRSAPPPHYPVLTASTRIEAPRRGRGLEVLLGMGVVVVAAILGTLGVVAVRSGMDSTEKGLAENSVADASSSSSTPAAPPPLAGQAAYDALLERLGAGDLPGAKAAQGEIPIQSPFYADSQIRIAGLTSRLAGESLQEARKFLGTGDVAAARSAYDRAVSGGASPEGAAEVARRLESAEQALKAETEEKKPAKVASRDSSKKSRSKTSQTAPPKEKTRKESRSAPRESSRDRGPSSSSKAEADALINRAEGALDNKEWSSASTWANQAARLNPGDTRVRRVQDRLESKAGEMIRRAEDARSEGTPRGDAKARELYRMALEVAPTGKGYTYRGQAEKGIRALDD